MSITHFIIHIGVTPFDLGRLAAASFSLLRLSKMPEVPCDEKPIDEARARPQGTSNRHSRHPLRGRASRNRAPENASPPSLQRGRERVANGMETTRCRASPRAKATTGGRGTDSSQEEGEAAEDLRRVGRVRQGAVVQTKKILEEEYDRLVYVDCGDEDEGDGSEDESDGVLDLASSDEFAMGQGYPYLRHIKGWQTALLEAIYCVLINGKFLYSK